MTTIKFNKVHEKATVPRVGTSGSAGADLFVVGDYLLLPNASEATLVKTGIKMELPKGYHAKVFLRSSTGLKTKLRLANGTGIIDEDYRGELCLIVENIGKSPCRLFEGDRIAQLLLEKTEEITFEEVSELSNTERSEGGFGSTNKPKQTRKKKEGTK